MTILTSSAVSGFPVSYRVTRKLRYAFPSGSRIHRVSSAVFARIATASEAEPSVCRRNSPGERCS